MDVKNSTRLSSDFDTQRTDYDSSKRVNYIGIASIYADETAEGWVIKRCDYDTDGNLLSIKYAYKVGCGIDGFIWADRASYDYR